MPGFGVLVLCGFVVAVIIFAMILAYCSVVDGAPRT